MQQESGSPALASSSESRARLQDSSGELGLVGQSEEPLSPGWLWSAPFLKYKHSLQRWQGLWGYLEISTAASPPPQASMSTRHTIPGFPSISCHGHCSPGPQTQPPCCFRARCERGSHMHALSACLHSAPHRAQNRGGLAAGLNSASTHTCGPVGRRSCKSHSCVTHTGHTILTPPLVVLSLKSLRAALKSICHPILTQLCSQVALIHPPAALGPGQWPN